MGKDIGHASDIWDKDDEEIKTTTSDWVVIGVFAIPWLVGLGTIVAWIWTVIE